MEGCVAVIVVACVAVASSLAEQQDHSCPVWLHLNSSQMCQCYNHLQDIVRCNNHTREVAILDCYCMTASESNDIEVGKCIYNCANSHTRNDPIYKPVRQNISDLNDQMCGHFNRQGRFCGHCRDGYYPPVYSYSVACTNCTGNYNWLKYITVAFVPQTIFFILVLSFRISATSPQLNGFILIAQAMSIPELMRFVELTLEGHKITSVVARILFSMYGIWNLDFFRMLIPNICLQVNTLQALALDYVVVSYLLLLTIISYTLLQLYTCNSRFTNLLRPLDACFNCIRYQIDARTSLIDAFATFLLLSYIRLSSVSFDLLVPTQVFNATGDKIGLYLYYDASVEYFGKEHLPYAITALAVVLVFILLPLLLLMAFPMRCFQRRLGKCGLQFQGLRIFMDSFQGCYKDGTNRKNYDCRYFPAIYLALRIVLFTAYALTLNQTWFSIAISAITVVIILMIIAQPYKKEFSSYNAVEAVHALLLVMWLAAIAGTNTSTIKSKSSTDALVTLTAIVTVLPQLYISFIIGRWVLTRDRVQRRLGCLLACCKRNRYEELQGNDSFLEGIDQRYEPNSINNNEPNVQH